MKCGFESLPGNDHCWINGHCAVCNITQTPENVEILPFEFDNDSNTPTRGIVSNDL